MLPSKIKTDMGAGMKSFLGSLGLAVVIASPAMAADMPVKARAPAPVPVAAFSWSGCHIGVQGGGAWGRSRHDGTFPQLGAVNQYTPWFDVSGGLVGGTVGCDYQFGGNFVVGAEGDFSWTNKSGSSSETGPLAVLQGDLGVVDETREKWITTARGRAGWAWDRALFYVTGGFAAAKVDGVINVPPIFGPANVGTFTASNTLYGWTVGAGFEYAFWNSWSVKGEYLYAKFDNKDYRYPGTPVVNIPRSGLNLDNNIVRVGLNWRFGCLGGCSVVAKY
jgi:outer membrane immunogenic protein